MDAVCLLVAGALVTTLPHPTFTLAWTHSVQKTRWTERYGVEGNTLRLLEAVVEGSGAGMEPGPDAVFRAGAWRWRPDRRVAELVLRRSPFTPDYAICNVDGCRELDALVGPRTDDAVVTVRPCPSPG
jgi:hypothetical protein